MKCAACDEPISVTARQCPACGDDLTDQKTRPTMPDGEVEPSPCTVARQASTNDYLRIVLILATGAFSSLTLLVIVARLDAFLSSYTPVISSILYLLTTAPIAVGFILVGRRQDLVRAQRDQLIEQERRDTAKRLLETHNLASEALECARHDRFDDAYRITETICALIPTFTEPRAWLSAFENHEIPSTPEQAGRNGFRLVGTPFAYAFPHGHSTIRIGRRRGLELTIRDARDDYKSLHVSRLHLTIHRCWGEYIAIDHSRRGTKLNNHIMAPNAPYLLQLDDRLTLSGPRLLCHHDNLLRQQILNREFHIPLVNPTASIRSS